MELTNKHHLGRKLRRSWLVSYIYIFKLTNYNLRIISTTSGYAINGMELANKHHLGRKLRRSWLVSYRFSRNR